MSPFASLVLKRLNYMLAIGVSDQERKSPQPVSITLEIRFAEAPPACMTDQLDDTIGYDRISEFLEKVVRQKEYHLIEALGHDVYSACKRLLPKNSRLAVTVLKEHPPIENLKDGASFRLGDWES